MTEFANLAPHLRRRDVETRHLFDTVIAVNDPVDFGMTPRGQRRVRIGDGGIFKGDRLEGEVLPGGTNWFLTRADGVGEFSVRLGLRTTGGDTIYMQSDGYFHFPPEVAGTIADGSATPEDYYFRERTRLETGAEALNWLNSIIAVGSGWFGSGFVGMSIHEIR